MAVKELLIARLLDAADDFPYIMYYVIEVFRKYDEQTIREIIRRVRPEEEEQMMSLFARDMLAKGRQDGIQIGELRGEQKGEVKMLTHLLQRRFGVLPEWVTQRVSDADPSALKMWADRVLDGCSLEGVFADGA
ncbi:MAG: hypothetical protein HQL87_04800 [Magnetococcales bacterium]|nr:hypothetical protein [Magnetococcales bacterium]